MKRKRKNKQQSATEPELSKKRPFWFKVLAVVLFGVLPLAVIDVGVGMYLTGVLKPPASDGGVARVDVLYGTRYTYTPKEKYMTGGVETSLNGWGFRGKDWKFTKSPSSYRVVCLGDSFTFGVGCEDKDTWPAQLETQIDHPDYVVRNVGLPGWNTEEEVSFFLGRAIQLNPDLVLLCFNINDATDFRRKDQEPYEAVFSPFWVGHSWICRTLESRRVTEHTIAAYQKEFEDSAKGWQVCKQKLMEFKRFCAIQRLRVALVLYPSLDFDLDDPTPYDHIYDKVLRTAKDLGLDTIDLRPAFAQTDPKKLWVHPGDHHPNALANQKAAVYLHTQIKAQGWLDKWTFQDWVVQQKAFVRFHKIKSARLKNMRAKYLKILPVLADQSINQGVQTLKAHDIKPLWQYINDEIQLVKPDVQAGGIIKQIDADLAAIEPMLEFLEPRLQAVKNNQP